MISYNGKHERIIKSRQSNLLFLFLTFPLVAQAADSGHSMKSWKNSGELFSLKKESRIYLMNPSEALIRKLEDKDGEAQQLRYLTGLPLNIVSSGDIKEGDIIIDSNPDKEFLAVENNAFTENNPLTTNVNRSASRNVSQNVSSEGYLLKINQQNIKVNYDKDDGALRAINTIELRLASDGKETGEHSDMHTGEGYDYPSMETRELMLDVARKFMTTDEIIGLMAKMNLNKMNTLHIHLNDTSPTGDYFRLYSPLRPELKPKDDLYYTQQDWSKLETAASAYGIKIIPEFESPGHAGVWTGSNSQLVKLNNNKDHIDVSNKENIDVTSDYIANIIKVFNPWFKGDRINLGGEESENKQTDITSYLNELIEKVKAIDPSKKIDVWQYNTAGKGKTIDPNLNKSVKTYVWGYWIEPEKLKAKIDSSVAGTDWIMARGFYVVPLASNQYLGQGLSSQKVYERYAERFGFEKYVPTGNMLANWNDKGNTYGFETINAALAQMIPGFGFVTWSQPQYDAKGQLISWNEAMPQINKISQEFSTFWLRQRYPYLTAKQAEEILKETASHRFIDANKILQTGGTASDDPMGWDPLDMANAYRGPLTLSGSAYIVELPGEGNFFQFAKNSLPCHDLLASTDHSGCEADTWRNDLTDGTSASGSKIGTLEKYGEGTLSLYGKNSFHGGITVHDGYIEVMNDSNLGATSAPLTLNGGGIKFESSSSLSPIRTVNLGPYSGEINTLNYSVILPGIVNGSGNLYKTGSGSLFLTNKNNYTGITDIRQGAIFLAEDGDISKSQAIILSGRDSLLDVSKVNDATQLNNLSGSPGSSLNSGDKEVILNQYVDSTFSGSIKGSGNILKEGPNKLILNGNSDFSGNLLVNSGSVAINNNLPANIFVSNGAILSGAGHVRTLSLPEGSTLNPGNSIGTLSATDQITFDKNSTYNVEISQDGRSDRVDSGGDILIKGGTINVSKEHGGLLTPEDIMSSFGKKYSILTANKSVQGRFTNVFPNYLFLGETIQYTDKAAVLTVGRNSTPFSVAAKNRSQTNVANSLEGFTFDNPLYRSYLIYGNPELAHTLLKQLSGQIFADTASYLLQSDYYISDTLSTRMSNYDHSDISKAFDSVDGIWIKLLQNRGRSYGQDDISGFDGENHGFLIGYDADVLHDTHLGAAVGYTRSSIKNDYDGNAHTDSAHIAIYGQKSFNPLSLKTSILNSWHRIDSHRNVDTLSDSYLTSSAYNANSQQVSAELTYSVKMRKLDFEPFVNLIYQNYHLAGLHESHSPASVSAEKQNIESVSSTLGARLYTSPVDIFNTQLRGFSEAGFNHQLKDTSREINLRFEDNSIGFDTSSVSAPRNSVLIKAGLEISLQHESTLQLNVSKSYSNRFTSNSYNLNFIKRF